MFRALVLFAVILGCATFVFSSDDVEGVVKLQPERHFQGSPTKEWPVSKIHVKVGYRVTAGQCLLEFDPALFPHEKAKAEWESAKHTIEVLKAQLRLRQQMMERFHRLAGAGAASRQEDDEHTERADVLKVELNKSLADERAAYAAFRMALYDYDTYQHLKSPINGQVVAVNSSLGLVARPTNAQLVWVEVIDLSVVDVVFKATQEEIGQYGLKVGRQLEISGRQKLQGKITFISPVMDGGQRMDVKMEVENKDELLHINEKVRINLSSPPIADN